MMLCYVMFYDIITHGSILCNIVLCDNARNTFSHRVEDSSDNDNNNNNSNNSNNSNDNDK